MYWHQKSSASHHSSPSMVSLEYFVLYFMITLSISDRFLSNLRINEKYIFFSQQQDLRGVVYLQLSSVQLHTSLSNLSVCIMTTFNIKLKKKEKNVYVWRIRRGTEILQKVMFSSLDRDLILHTELCWNIAQTLTGLFQPWVEPAGFLSHCRMYGRLHVAWEAKSRAKETWHLLSHFRHCYP